MPWALDLGTSNTALAHWDDGRGAPSLVELPALCRLPGEKDHLLAPRMVPSATLVDLAPSLRRRMAHFPWLYRRRTFGRFARIGRQALEGSEGGRAPNFTPGFKSALGRSPLRPLARGPGGTCSAREVAGMYMRELLAEVQRATGERIESLVVTVPVDAYEHYRAELSRALRKLGVSEVRFVDEPVAAAFGYGVGVTQAQTSLVVDFGGGTLDLALVRFGAAASAGQCEVIAKAGRPIGGDVVDRWLLSAFCAREGMRVPGLDGAHAPGADVWLPLMLAEACRVKEALFFSPEVAFGLVPPDEEREFEARLRGEQHASDLTVDKTFLQEVLQQRDLFGTLDACVQELRLAAHRKGVALDGVQDVLMVGGSTLLPGVFSHFEQHFGRDRVRAWQPFEAVAYGAAVFAGGKVHADDHIVHDYAIRTRKPSSGDFEYSVVVPRGTRFPTAAPTWRRQLVPTCGRGEPETYFKLVLCEMGRAFEGERTFAWDEHGTLHRLGGKEGQQFVIVPLNEDNPTLGTLEPPHEPGDTRPRLEVAFGVDAQRWLIAKVTDLHRQRVLLDGEPVVRLM